MALIALHTRRRPLATAVAGALEARHAVASAPSWEGSLRLVRERPVTLAMVDAAAFSGGACEEAVRELGRLFPHVCVVVFAGLRDDPMRLFRLGRAGVSHLVLLPVDHLGTELPRAVARALGTGTTATVLRSLSAHVPRRELTVVRTALDQIHRRLSAEELAAEHGLSRPFLSECLKEWSLPSAGQLLLWARLLHAGRWLTEPGRTGESVARQLEYHDGAGFRRALRHYTGATPTRVAEQGGLSFVLRRFMRRCGFGEPPRGRRVSVA